MYNNCVYRGGLLLILNMTIYFRIFIINISQNECFLYYSPCITGMAVFTLVPFLAAFRARLSAPRVSALILQILGASPDGAYVSPFGSVVGPLLRSAVWAISFRPFMVGDIARLGPSFGLVPRPRSFCPPGHRAISNLFPRLLRLRRLFHCSGSSGGSALLLLLLWPLLPVRLPARLVL